WGAEGPDDHRAIQFWRDPLVMTVTPSPDSSGPAPEEITTEFAINVSPIGGDASQVIAVSDAAGNPVAGTVAQRSGRAFTFTPDTPLAAGAYTVTVFNVEQTAPMVAPYGWRFT